MRAEKDRPHVDVEPIGDGYPGMNGAAEWWVVELLRREIAAHMEAIWDRLDKLEGNDERNGQD